MESNIMQILVYRLQMLLRLTVPVWQISSIPDFTKLENLFQSSVTKGVDTKMKKKNKFPLKLSRWKWKWWVFPVQANERLKVQILYLLN